MARTRSRSEDGKPPNINTRTSEIAKRRLEAEAKRRSKTAPQEITIGTVIHDLAMEHLDPAPGEPKRADGATVLRATG